MFFTPSFMLALLTIPSVIAQAPNVNDPQFRAAVLNIHNADRAKHGVPSLTWDNNLATFAQNAANDCAFKHTGGPYGENLYGFWTTLSRVDYITGTTKAVHDSWYNEISLYDFNRPGFSSATGHFTQVVWKGTKSVGCAWNAQACLSNGMNFYKLVCEYSPRGNIVGGTWFRDNVPRPVV